MRVVFAILAACGGASPAPAKRVISSQPAPPHTPWVVPPPPPLERPRLTLTGLVGMEKEITGDTPISQVRFRTMPGLTFFPQGPRVYGSLDGQLSLLMYGTELVELIYVVTPLITNDGDFVVGEPVDDALSARLTRDRCRMGDNPLHPSRDVICRLEGFELHLDGELPVPWSLTGHKIVGVAVHVRPAP